MIQWGKVNTVTAEVPASPKWWDRLVPRRWRPVRTTTQTVSAYRVGHKVTVLPQTEENVRDNTVTVAVDLYVRRSGDGATFTDPQSINLMPHHEAVRFDPKGNAPRV